MNYYVKDINSVEYGPINELELIKLTQQGLVVPQSLVKKALMPKWEEAKHLPFLQEAFAEAAVQNTKKTAHAQQQTAPENTKLSFENQLIPIRAGLWLRFQAFVYDAILLLLIFAGLAMIATGILHLDSVSGSEFSYVKKKAERIYLGAVRTESTTQQKFVCISAKKNKSAWIPVAEVRNTVVIVFILFLLIAIPYHVTPLLLTAQTRGMRFFGIFLCDKKNYLVEVYEKRAYAYWLIALFTFWLSPFFVMIKKSTPAERLTGIRVTRIAAKKL